MSDDRDTLPPEEITLESVYRMQVQLSEQVAVLVSVVRTLASELVAVRQAAKPASNGSARA